MTDSDSDSFTKFSCQRVSYVCVHFFVFYHRGFCNEPMVSQVIGISEIDIPDLISKCGCLDTGIVIVTEGPLRVTFCISCPDWDGVTHGLTGDEKEGWCISVKASRARSGEEREERSWPTVHQVETVLLGGKAIRVVWSEEPNLSFCTGMLIGLCLFEVNVCALVDRENIWDPIWGGETCSLGQWKLQK